MKIQKLGRRLRKTIDEARDQVEERPQQAMSRYATQCAHPKAAVYARDAGDERFRVLGVGPSNLKLALVPFTHPIRTILTSDQTMECFSRTPIQFASQGSLLDFGFDTDREIRAS